MSNQNDQTKILAFAILELRYLLADCLGSENEAPPHIRQAAHLAYALHNQAIAALEGRDFDLDSAVNALSSVDRMLGSDLKNAYFRHMGDKNITD